MKLKLLAAASLLFATVAQAQPTTQNVGTVNILGTQYFVSILFDKGGINANQSFDALNPSITFTSASDAQAAGSALISAFGSDYAWNPASGFSGARIVYGSTTTNYQYMTIVTNESSVFGPFDYSKGSDNYFSFAQFTPVSVPEPGSFSLLAVGISGLVAIRRRRRTMI